MTTRHVATTDAAEAFARIRLADQFGASPAWHVVPAHSVTQLDGDREKSDKVRTRPARPAIRFLMRVAVILALVIGSGTICHAEEPITRGISAVVSIAVLRAPVPASMPEQGMTNAAETRAMRGTRIIGSGFVIDPSGLIVTNQHVVDHARDILVILHDNTLLRATLVAASRSVDIAIISVRPEAPLPAVHFGDSDLVHVADPVFAVGNPLGLGGSVTRGIVSALDRDIRETPYDDFIQTDAAINHGNSGGPLFDAQGEVIGVNTVIFSPEPTSGSIGLGFAIPANDVRFVVAALLSPGGMRSGTLDFAIQQVTPEIADALGMRKAEGVIVGGTREGGAASRCGIVAGDIILRYGAMPVKNVRALARAIARTRPGTSVPMTILRNDEPMVVNAIVQELPLDNEDGMQAAAAPADLGWALRRATMPSSHAVPGGAEDAGMMVTDIRPGGAAEEAGIRPGDTVLQIQQEKIATDADLSRVIGTARMEGRHYVIVLLRNEDGLRWFALSLE
jgi:serine protease Do